MPSPTQTVALVETDVSTSLLISRQLRAHGYVVRAFESAGALIDSGGLDGIDCLLLDIDFKGMSGPGLQQYLQDMGYTFPVIFMTEEDASAARLQALRMGCSDFLSKPVRAQDLAGAIGMALAGPHGYC
jgi:FixJ family two-component response regulator